MSVELDHNDSAVSLELADSLRDKWEKLCASYLPVVGQDSIWRYSRRPAQGDPEQGWKLHVSATVLTAVEVLKKVAPLLCSKGAQFKAPSSLRELQRLNSGLSYGYSQVGKFITVYPRSAEEAVSLAQGLHELTCGLSAPSVPFDRQFQPGSSVYYRYGSFKRLEIENADGTCTYAMRDPEGKLVPDLRESEAGRPGWVSDPFVVERGPEYDVVVPIESPLSTTFRAFQALAQRGKGGVYKALNLSVCPPVLCILKEGRAGGELDWDGRDGHWRVRHEERVLASLRAVGVSVPRIYSSFEVEGNYYLVTEFIEGETLQALLHRRQRRLPLSLSFLYGARLSHIIAQLHGAGWAWRDCKPANIILTKDGLFRPIDFEGACRAERPERTRWSTPDFTPPDTGEDRSGFCYDLYALGAVLYLLLTGRLPKPPDVTPIERLRRNVPARVREIITELLSADARRQPCARIVVEELETNLNTRLSAVPPVRARRDGRVREEKIGRSSQRAIQAVG